MPSDFDLIVTADTPSRTAELRLLDGYGSQLAFRPTDFKTIAVGRQRGLFDLRNDLRLYVEPGQEAARAAEVGVCIAEEVLGEEIFRILWQSEAQRTLRVELPGASEEENHLAAALARVPWELARPAATRSRPRERGHPLAPPATTVGSKGWAGAPLSRLGGSGLGGPGGEGTGVRGSGRVGFDSSVKESVWRGVKAAHTDRDDRRKQG